MSAVDALIGAVVGSLLTAGLWAGRYLLIEYREKTRLERMIHTELSHMDVLDNIDDIPEDEFPDPSAFPTIVFESNAGKIGLLDQQHRHSVHAFYSYLEVTKTMMEQEIENNEKDLQQRKRIKYNLESLRERRRILLDALEE